MRWLLLACALALPAAAQTLRVGSGAQQAGTFDPHRATSTEDKTPVGWMFEGLVRFPPGSADPGRLEPAIAESWTRSEDGLGWTFRLRQGVQFHHGFGTVSAEDVVYSVQRAADPKRSSFAGDYRAVASVEALDPLTVRVLFREPHPAPLGLFANYHGGHVVSARAAQERGDGFANAPVGTGPFAFVRTEAGSSTLAAHPGYRLGKPRIETIRLLYVPSDQSRELGFTAGEIDLFYGRREQRWVERVRALPNAKVDVFGPGEFRTLLINTRQPPLDDLRVRQAIAHAVDVPAIVRFVGADVARPWPSPVPPGYLGSISDVATFPPDPARARALLAEAGHPGGITIKATVSSITSQLPIMEVVQAQLRRAGITLDMDVVEHATYHARIRQDLSALTFYGAARFPVADSYLTQFYHSRSAPGQPQASLNFAHCAVADAQIDAARVATDPAKQLALWAEAQRKIAAAVCSVPLYDLLQVWARTARLEYGYVLEGSLNLAPPITEATTLR